MIYYLFSPMGKSWPQEVTERSSRWGAPNENLLDRGPLLPSRAVYPSSAQVGKKEGGEELVIQLAVCERSLIIANSSNKHQLLRSSA